MTSQERPSARRCFVAMAATYLLGVFNDIFFKQAVLLLAVTSGLSGLQGRATELFALPFFVCRKVVTEHFSGLFMCALERNSFAVVLGSLLLNWHCF